jgi:hypothetical protein
MEPPSTARCISGAEPLGGPASDSVTHPTDDAAARADSRDMETILLRRTVFLTAIGLALPATAQPPLQLFVDAAAPPGSNCGSAAAPCRRITDALVLARRARAADAHRPISLEIAAGTYVGTMGNNPAGKLEDLPLILNVPGLHVHGATRLPLDGAGRPYAPTDGRPQTVITNDGFVPKTCIPLNLVTIDRARSCDRRGCGALSGGDGTSVEGLKLVDPTGSFSAMAAYRAQDLSIRQIWVQGTGQNVPGIALSYASGTVAETLVTGTFHPLYVSSGNAQYPARVTVTHNTEVGNEPSGLNLSATDTADWIRQYVGAGQSASLQLEEVCRSGPGNFFCSDMLTADCTTAPGDSLSAVVSDNDLEGGGVGLRLWLVDNADEPTVPTHSSLTAVVTNNILHGDRHYGLDINEGWSAADQLPSSVDLDLTLSGNQMSGGRAPALLAFEGIQQLGGSPLFPMQPLQSSTYRIVDLDGELGGVGAGARYDWDIPTCDPGQYPPPFLLPDSTIFRVDGPNCATPYLGDVALINGLPVPLGARLSPQL